MTEPAPKLKVSFRLFALNVLGAMLAGLGLLNLSGQLAGVHPLLALTGIGWILLAVGLGLMVWFMVDIFKRIRALQLARQHDTR